MVHSAKTLTRRLFRDDVVDYLIDCILKSRFLPGDKVLENQIADELAIGKGAVREALRDLVGMGFLEAEPYKGTRVRFCSVRDLRHYYQARMALVSVLTRRIFTDGQADQLDRERLQNITDSMVAHSQGGDYLSQVKLDLIFHRVFAEGTGNPYLVKAWDSLDHYYWVSLHAQVEQYGCPYQAEKHYTILEAINSGDVEKISRVQIKNLEQVLKEVEPVFVARGLLRC